ncbi:MBL fold metallo-hydrolase [Dissulfurirhabdus thermomarina]|uniref:MBL fold metallo-hydrolase n=1 Tax=Dissulfurirhabdus thermomarina TaxID=1765737 RepID=A0A6N9TSM0_DISTH|nr:MBL fold metallo-hydrolase [Dissulfurirhabdus thermomarina]NMX23383.1 MBL fold metallo-hydrolase [Dissulfurirhabdus thermomarina]
MSLLLLAAALWAGPAAAAGPDPPADWSRPIREGGRFRNPGEDAGKGVLDFLRWRWGRLWKSIPGPEAYRFPRVHADPSRLRAPGDAPSVTWIGHATVLLQVAGRNLLTDPHFSGRASPVGWAGPRRVVPPGVPLADLPPIHGVLISHDHYDSLDRPTIQALLRRPGGGATVFFVPLGLGPWLRDLGARRVVELDWWEAATLDGLRVTAVPAKHWSKRALLGRNRTLWAGWVVEAPGLRFYFAGDTGYDPALFREIGRRLGPFDLAAIPIGAYEPRWFMAPYHVTPEEALRIHLDVGARRSVAIHWGTFILTDEPLDEPPRRLARARAAAGLPPGAFVVLRHGETLRLPAPAAQATPGP